jgi:hypothetical protein
MTISDEAQRPVDQWVAKNPAQACRGDERQALLAHLKLHFPRKTPEKLNNTLKMLLRQTRPIIQPECTNKVYEPRAVGSPTAVSKEVVDVRNAINNPINNPIYGPISGPIRRAAMKRKRREEAIGMLEEKGYKDRILPELAMEELVDEILAEERLEFDGESIISLLDKTQKEGLDFCMYVGFTEQQIPQEALSFLGRRANRPKKKDGKKPCNRPVLLRGDETLHEKKRHFTAKQCEDELQMKHTMVYFTELKLNAHMVEDALQTRLQCYPLGVRLWREVAKGQTEKDKTPEEGVAYKVFVTYSFGMHTAINEGECRVVP